MSGNPSAIETPPSVRSHLSSSSKAADNDNDESTVDIDYWSRSFLALVYPVSFTIIISACLASFLYDLYTQSTVFEDAGLISSTKGIDAAPTSTIIWESLKVALIVISVIVLVTCLLVAIVYFGCVKLLYGYLFLMVIAMFSLLNISILSMIVAQSNCSIDWLTIVFYAYNILAIAVLSLFWIAPDLVKQMITIYQCIIMVLYVLKIAPEWIAWILLPLLAIWDMIAVLLPFGPLYLLLGIFQKRQLQVPPMMIYTTSMWFSYDDQNINALTSIKTSSFLPILAFPQHWSTLNILFLSSTTLRRLFNRQHSGPIHKNTNASDNNEESKKQSSKRRKARKSMLGLGDFIFYSILLAKTVFTSERNIFAIIIVYLCIIMGMLATTIILVVLHRPLPALPISLLLGLAVFFQYNHIGDRFADILRFPTGPVLI